MTKTFPEGARPQEESKQLETSRTGGLELSSLRDLLGQLSLPAEAMSQIKFLLSKAERVVAEDGGVIEFASILKSENSGTLLQDVLHTIDQNIQVFPNAFLDADDGKWGLDVAVAEKIVAPERVFLDDGSLKILSEEDRAAFEQVAAQIAEMMAMWKRLNVLLAAAKELAKSAEIEDAFTALNIDEKTISNSMVDVEAALTQLQRDLLDIMTGKGKLKLVGLENLDEDQALGLASQIPQSLLGVTAAPAVSAPAIRASEVGHIRTEFMVAMNVIILLSLLTACAAAAPETPQVETARPDKPAEEEDAPEVPVSAAPTLVPSEISPEGDTPVEVSSYPAFGSAESGELRSLTTVDIEDFPEFRTLEELSGSILAAFREAWLTAGQDEGLVVWEGIQIQALQLNGQDEYEFFMQVPITNGRVLSFLALGSNEAGELIPVDSDTPASRFLLLSSENLPEEAKYVIGLPGLEGSIDKAVIEIDLRTGEATLKGVFVEGGEVSLGNMVNPDSPDGGRVGLAAMVGISELTAQALADLAREEVVLRISEAGTWQVYDEETEAVLWELISGEWEKGVEMFEVCPIENFRDCELTEEQLLNGDYFRWLNEVVAPSLAPIFQERYNAGTMQTDVPMVPHSFGETNYVSFELSASFQDENTRPFMRHETFAYLPAEWITPEMREAGATATGYFVSTTFMYEVTNPETGEGIVHPIVLLTIGNFDDPKITQGLISSYQAVHEPIFYTQPKYPDGIFDPMVQNIFNKFNSSGKNMESRIRDFMGGDYSAFSEPGLAIMTAFLTEGTDWYED